MAVTQLLLLGTDQDLAQDQDLAASVDISHVPNKLEIKIYFKIFQTKLCEMCVTLKVSPGST